MTAGVKSNAHVSGATSGASNPKAQSSMEVQVHKEVDARGLNCPLPILRAKKALADMQSGQILKVLATDPGSQRDFAAFSKQTGNEIGGIDVARQGVHFDAAHATPLIVERTVNKKCP
jgi:tRNA 2-thiouridine synthesizing protein A